MTATSDPEITLSKEAHKVLVKLGATLSGRDVLRLKELRAAALTVAQPEDDDVVLRGRNGFPLLAVSRRLMDRLSGDSELIVDLSEVGEPSFRLVQRSTVD